MTKERAAELWPLMKAFSEGKTIQYLDRGGILKSWKEITNPSFEEGFLYRVKSEPREIYLIWNGAWPNNSLSHFSTKGEAEAWRNQLPLHREYKKFCEVLE